MSRQFHHKNAIISPEHHHHHNPSNTFSTANSNHNQIVKNHQQQQNNNSNNSNSNQSYHNNNHHQNSKQYQKSTGKSQHSYHQQFTRRSNRQKQDFQRRQDSNFSSQEEQQHQGFYLSALTDQLESSSLPMDTNVSNAFNFSDKKGKVNVNHLLNFQFPPRQNAPGSMGGGSSSCSSSSHFRRRKQVYSEPYNKEKFINSNYRFVMQQGLDYSVHLFDPDTLVDWDKINQVIMCSNKPPSCPICLSPPTAAKVTKCGHVYCWPCILHYLDLADKQWRKCPICYDSIYSKDLKSVKFQKIHDLGKPSPQFPSSLKMFLMKRNQSSAIALPKTGFSTWTTENLIPPEVTNAYAFPFAKLLIGSPEYLLGEIYEKDIAELKTLLAETGEDVKLSTSSQSYIPGLTQSPAVVDHSMSERPFIERALQSVQDSKRNLLQGNHVLKQVEEQHQSYIPGINKLGVSNKSQKNTKRTMAPTSPNSPEHYQQQQQLNSPYSQDHTIISPTANNSKTENTYYFYQSSDGQHIYMHPLDIKILKYEFSEYPLFPEKIQVDVIQLSESTLDEDLRKRCKYLGHLPLGCDVCFCEVDLTGIVSEPTLKFFEKELKQRIDKRLQKEKKEEMERKKQESKMTKSSNKDGSLKLDTNAFQQQFDDYVDDEQFPALSSSIEDDRNTNVCPNPNTNNFDEQLPLPPNSAGLEVSSSPTSASGVWSKPGSFAKVAAGTSMPSWPALDHRNKYNKSHQQRLNQTIAAARQQHQFQQNRRVSSGCSAPQQQYYDDHDDPSSSIEDYSYHEEDYYVMDDELGWSLDFEEAVMTSSSTSSQPLQSPLSAVGGGPKKKGKKNQVVLMSNSSGRRRF